MKKRPVILMCGVLAMVSLNLSYADDESGMARCKSAAKESYLACEGAREDCMAESRQRIRNCLDLYGSSRVAAAEAALEEFKNCARNAADLEGEEREVDRRQGLYSTGFSNISYDSMRQDIKGFNRKVDKFKKNCMHSFSVPIETIKSHCSHPAYHSRWCDSF